MLLVAVACVSFCASGSAAERLSGDGLKQEISGKEVFLATPFGGEFPLNYHANGVVDGSGKAVGLGKFMQPNDSGSWWVDGENLCQKWKSWYNGKPFCFTIEKLAPGKIAWTRDDGLKGTARVSD
ncbi:hypothetical protein EYR15_05705 [Hansschlegelia quercus]|uniref:DUF995 domain-containing protein n=2 Tax=Hansschlegelia quercus TaxID=2528245 RepID=A0A4Q9GQM3_9HYPH|nr:hypothetical protein EYR15_05705 [Hansschlegelia quercus]